MEFLVNTDRLILILLFITSDLLLIGLSIPLIMRRIPPNGLYGFRTPATLKDEALWYDVNAYAGKRLLIAGVASLVVCLVIIALPLSLDAFALLHLSNVLVFYGWAIIASFVYLHRRKQQ
jgi:uncharacterized membrane protein